MTLPVRTTLMYKVPGVVYVACLQSSDRMENYVDVLCEGREKKGLARPQAYDMVKV